MAIDNVQIKKEMGLTWRGTLLPELLRSGLRPWAVLEQEPMHPGYVDSQLCANRINAD
jgi:hypothetical protein